MKTIKIVKQEGNGGTNNRCNVEYSNGELDFIWIKDGYSSKYGWPTKESFERQKAKSKYGPQMYCDLLVGLEYEIEDKENNQLNENIYEDRYENIRNKVIAEFGFNEEDFDTPEYLDYEDEINREADRRFRDMYGYENLQDALHYQKLLKDKFHESKNSTYNKSRLMELAGIKSKKHI